MADFKFPADGTEDGEAPLNLDQNIDLPQDRTEAGELLTFEVNMTGITSVDKDVEFTFFSGLSFQALDASNILQSFTGIKLNASLSGSLTFLRDIVNTAHSSYRVVISGTDPGSAATFLIRTRAID